MVYACGVLCYDMYIAVSDLARPANKLAQPRD